MGKYKSEDIQTNRDYCLEAIANELAEANRLKRLELMQFLDYSKFIPKEELEDQA